MVNYGPTTNYIFSSPLNSTPSIAHTVTLNGLTPSTTYNFAVVSAGPASVPSTSANQTVTTAAATATAPNVGFVPPYGMTNSSVTLTWSTDVPSNSVVAYGTTPALGQLSPVQTLSTSHQVVLTGLYRGTKYYFVDMSTGAGGATGYSPLLSFTTTGPASSVPVISNVASSNLSTTSATITWNTDVPGTSQVNYGTTASYGLSSPLDATLTTNHSVTLMGLSPGIRYVFQVVSAGTSGASTFGANMTGITVWAWGDSLTLGYGDYLSQNTYPLYLSIDIGTPVANEGVGGWTSTQIAQLRLATPASFPAGNCNLIWSGGNNHNQVSQVLSDIASMVAALASPACFLVLGDINRETAPIGSPDYNAFYSTNASLAAQYGNNYLNIRELLVQDYNSALALDVADHANDVPPASLRAVQPLGTITSGALDSVSCVFNVSNGTQGPGTAVIIDAETILVNAVSNNLITDCTRGYNGTAPASHAANVTYSAIDPIHLGDKGYEFVALQVAAWFETQFPLNFNTPLTNASGPVITAVGGGELDYGSACDITGKLRTHCQLRHDIHTQSNAHDCALGSVNWPLPKRYI
jgi:lysophospholipase L1-like esterase